MKTPIDEFLSPSGSKEGTWRENSIETQVAYPPRRWKLFMEMNWGQLWGCIMTYLAMKNLPCGSLELRIVG